MSNLTDAMKEAYACAPSNDAIIETLEVRHASIADPIYLVKNRTDLTLKLEDASTVLFKGAGFGMTLPAKNNQGLQQLAIKFDNVNQEVSEFLKTAKNYKTPVQLTYRPYLESDPNTVQMDPPLVLYLSDVKINLFEVSGTANFADLLNKKFPSERYNRRRFPALQR